MAFLLLIKYIRRWYAVMLLFALAIGGFIVMDDAMENSVTTALELALHPVARTYDLQEIWLGADVVVVYKGNVLVFREADSPAGIRPTAWDEAGERLQLLTEDNISYTIDDSRFPDIKLTYEPMNGYMVIKMRLRGRDWYFSRNENGQYLYLNPFGKWDSLNTVDGAFFDGYEYLISGRGYLWSRSIPLLRDRLILGSGADSFVYVFPQDDYVGKYNSGYMNSIVTKPHSLYLQIGVQSGVLALACLGVFYLGYMASSLVQIVRRRNKGYLVWVNIGILAGSFGYLVSGISNDSTISIAPIFWALLGIAIRINAHLSGKWTMDEKSL
jgi:hypothetical protein